MMLSMESKYKNKNYKKMQILWMDVRGGIQASETLSITQHLTSHTRILTRFAYGLSRLQVTKQKFNVLILTHRHLQVSTF